MHGDMIIPSEQAIENQKQEELQISNDGKDEMEDNNQEWLNLTLGGNAMLTARDSESQTMPNSRNVFSCTFRRYQSSRMMRMMSSPFSVPIGRQLRLQPHRLVDRTGRDRIVTVSKPQTGCGMAWTSYTLEDAMDLMWPGSFHFVPLELLCLQRDCWKPLNDFPRITLRSRICSATLLKETRSIISLAFSQQRLQISSSASTV